MSEYQRAVPVLQVANVESSLRWYVDVLGFTADTFPRPSILVRNTAARWRGDYAAVFGQCARGSLVCAQV